MRKKDEVVNKNPLLEAIAQINMANSSGEKEKKLEIVDIITFCDSPLYLNLLDKDNNFNLRLSQRVMLKSFYTGTRGNENLKLTKEEWEWLYKVSINEERDGVVYETNIADVIKKLLKKEQEGFNFRELNLVMGRRSGKCRYEKDRISTTEGSLTFRELCDRLNNGEKIGICTYDQKTLKRSLTYDIKAKDNGFVDCYEVETERGLREVSSHNHPYLVWRENSSVPTFIQMSDLLPGDRIATANCTELFGKGGIGVKKAALLGHLQELEGIEDIPDCIYKGSKEEITAFLSILPVYERHVSVNKNVAKETEKARSHTYYESSSFKLIYGVKHLLLKFGIHSYINETDVECNRKKFKVWKLVIDKEECIKKFEEEISIFSKKDEDKIKKITELTFLNSPSEIKILSYGKNIDDQFLVDMSSSDVKWDAIKSIKPVGKMPTVDLEVNPNHIIGGDIISHNTILASVISAYEAYKLLVINNEDPHAFYGLPADDEIAIINVALSKDQAGRLFGHIQSRLRNSPFFAGRIAKETTSEIRLYTKRDLEKQAKGAASGMQVHGSVVILCGHSNPDTLAGWNAILILFDELAFYDESGKVGGKYFYDRLAPSLSQFFKHGDGRLVEISSPDSMSGIFYDIHESARKSNGILSFQLPTWLANPDFEFDHPDLTSARKRSPERFAIEYGAQWGKGGTYGNYFEPGLIERCIRGDIGPHPKAQYGFNYYLHVDPAKSGPRYVAVMVARERYSNHLGKKRVRVRLANVWIWDPKPGVGLLFNEIDKEIIQICGRYRPMAVSYDDYNSIQSIQNLRSHGINTVETHYNRGFKNKIYQNLKDMMSYYPTSELWIYDDNRLILEMRCLKYRPTMRGISLVVDKQGDVQTDDVVDCLAGATMMASGNARAMLPETVTVHTGFR